MRMDIVDRLDLTAPVDLLVLPVMQNKVQENTLVTELNAALDGMLEGLIAQENFKARAGQSLVFPTLGRIGPVRVCLLGLGLGAGINLERIRRTGGRAADVLSRYRVATATLVCQRPEGVDLPLTQAAGALAEGLRLGLYRFDRYKSEEPDQPKYPGPDRVSLYVCEASAAPHGDRAGLEKEFRRAGLVTEGVLAARDLVNEIPEVMVPERLASLAREVAEKVEGLACRVLDEQEMAREKMGAALAVGRGSENHPRFIELTYAPLSSGPGDMHLALVGKGVTFDSGGLNLKPGESMVTMKMDMSGAAAVISAITVIARMKLPLRVTALVASVENMPSGRAYKPDDVVRAMNGTTIEIGNTDAEGRLTLADVLCWAVERSKATRIVDLATLTGACMVGLGVQTAGAFGNDRAWLEEVLGSAAETGEKCCCLPLDEDLADDMKSEIADVKNVGSGRYGGAIIGALFLKKFVGETPWVHLDIAGPAWADKKRDYAPVGGTGFGVRTLVRLAEKMAGTFTGQ